MRTNDGFISEKIATAHQAKTAFVYIRQSSVGQVTRHSESTELQYRLADRAVELGWPRERVTIIDEDLGKSGASSDNRTGFQKVMSEIGLGHAGLVLSFDASRLARNNRDWYQMLELCALFGTLIADNQTIYDPSQYHDRLLLGLSGIMSEAELHQIKQRMHSGAKQKAARGALRLRLPVGLSYLPDSSVALNPDEEVRARIQLVFDKFRELGTARAVTRYLLNHQLLMPIRPLKGPEPHDIVWRPSTSSRVLAVLKNPAYAGAYAYGKQKTDPIRRRSDRPYSGIVRLPIDQWQVLLHDHYPAYISWSQYLANLAQLEANMSQYDQGNIGAPRKGLALLQGIVRCGQCGGAMSIRYSGAAGQFPVYRCSYTHAQAVVKYCQEVRALGVDADVEQIILAALEPDKIAIALQAIDQLEAEQQALQRQWQLKLERARYEATRAERQYHQVEPENRLVARSLEARWEAALRHVEQTERDFQAWQQHHPLTITASNRREIAALARDLPTLWDAPTTTPADKKQIVRMLIQTVILDQSREPGHVWFQINWQTGAVTHHVIQRRVSAYKAHADLPAIETRIRQLHAQRKMDEQIAEQLNAEGFLTTKLKPFNSNAVWLLRKRMGLPSVIWQKEHPDQWQDGTYSVRGAAKLFGVYSGTIRTWILKGRVEAHQLKKGTPWHIILTPSIIDKLHAHLKHAKRSKGEAS